MSYSDVVPHDPTRSTAFSRAARSTDGRASTKKFSLNATSVTRSVGRSADRKRFTFCLTPSIASVMLSLMSIAVISSSGMFSAAKYVIGCRTSSSYTRKASRLRPRTNCDPSSTETVTCTMSTSTASAYSTPLVRALCTARRPPGR